MDLTPGNTRSYETDGFFSAWKTDWEGRAQGAPEHLPWKRVKERSGMDLFLVHRFQRKSFLHRVSQEKGLVVLEWQQTQGNALAELGPAAATS